jgi:hypothetical protein
MAVAEKTAENLAGAEIVQYDSEEYEDEVTRKVADYV